jgi:hypothetical protein
MGRKKHKRGFEDFDFDPYDDYDDDSALDEFADLARDFYSTDWEDPSGHPRNLSTRRKIERRNELKELYSEFDDWGDGFELENEW